MARLREEVVFPLPPPPLDLNICFPFSFLLFGVCLQGGASCPLLHKHTAQTFSTIFETALARRAPLCFFFHHTHTRPPFFPTVVVVCPRPLHTPRVEQSAAQRHCSVVGGVRAAPLLCEGLAPPSHPRSRHKNTHRPFFVERASDREIKRERELAYFPKKTKQHTKTRRRTFFQHQKTTPPTRERESARGATKKTNTTTKRESVSGERGDPWCVCGVCKKKKIKN